MNLVGQVEVLGVATEGHFGSAAVAALQRAAGREVPIREVAVDRGRLVAPTDGQMRCRVLSDVGTLEIFAQDGRIVIPQVLPPARPEPDKIGLRSLGGKTQINSLEVNYLDSIWK